MFEFIGFLVLAYGAMRLLQQDYLIGALLVAVGLAIVAWKNRVR